MYVYIKKVWTESILKSLSLHKHILYKKAVKNAFESEYNIIYTKDENLNLKSFMYVQCAGEVL